MSISFGKDDDAPPAKTIVIVLYGSWLAKAWHAISRRYIAFTIGPVVFTITHPDATSNARLLAHEAKHVEQWRRYWYIGFPLIYFYYTLRYGYWNNPLEREARRAERSVEDVR